MRGEDRLAPVRRPRLSVALTTFAHEPYIGACLDSILSQSRDFDMEVLVADDCSPDGTADVIARYASLHPDVLRVVDRPRNLGYVRNFDDVLRRCRGEYVAIFDGDDVMMPRKLQKQVDFLDANPDVVLVGHRAREFDSGTGRTRRWIEPPRIRDRYGIDDQLHWGSFLANSTKVFRQSALPVGGIPSEIRAIADWPLTIEIALHGTIGYLDEHLVDYRVHPGSIMRTISAWNQHLDLEWVMDDLERRYPGRFTHAMRRNRAYSQMIRGIALERDGRTAEARFAYRTGLRLHATYGPPLWARSIRAELRLSRFRFPSEREGRRQHGRREDGAPLRVLQLSHSVFPGDFIHVVARHLAATGAESYSLTFDSDMRDHGIDFARDGIRHSCLGPNDRRRVPLYAYEVARLIRRDRIDILHTHHYYEAIIGAIVVSVLRSRARWVLGRHYSDKVRTIEGGFKRRAFRAAERVAARSADVIIAPSTMVRDLVLADTPTSAPVLVIPYPMDPAKYDVPAASMSPFAPGERPKCSFLVGTFARLSPEKGHRYLFEATSSLVGAGHDIGLILVGEGPLEDELRADVCSRGLGSRITFLGWRDNPLELMAACDAIVQPTTSEAFSQAMAEALWMRRPLVMTDVSGARDLLGDDGEFGIVVPPHDPAALAAAVERLLADDDLCARLSEAGYERVRAYTSPADVLAQIDAAYRTVLA